MAVLTSTGGGRDWTLPGSSATTLVEEGSTSQIAGSARRALWSDAASHLEGSADLYSLSSRRQCRRARPCLATDALPERCCFSPWIQHPPNNRLPTLVAGSSPDHCPEEASDQEMEQILTRLRARLRSLLVSDDDESGQGMVEYALILVLIAVVVIVILTVVGNQVNNVFSNISSGLGT
jgi:pilus assembly protein Flp/PilA